MSDMKPCPFCGGTDLRTGGDDKVCGVACLTCQAVGPNHYGRFEWDNRAALSVIPQPVAVKPLDMFKCNVDAWGAADWFGRMADAVRGHDAARASGDEFADITADTFKNIMTSSAFRLVRDYEEQVRAALGQEVSQ